MFENGILFFEDVVCNILNYLCQNDSFKFLSINQSLLKMKRYLYNKYIFNYNNVVNLDTSDLNLIKKLEFKNNTYLLNEPYNLHNNLLELYINDEYFNYSLDKLPKNLITLSIHSRRFNQSVNNLPYNLKKLEIITKHPWSRGYLCFVKELNKLPSFLETLIIKDYNFNQSVDNLPKSLKNLTIESNYFNKKLDTLPNNLRKLTIRGILCKNIINLPNSLMSLKITSDKFNESFSNLPKNLKTLKLLVQNLINHLRIYQQL